MKDGIFIGELSRQAVVPTETIRYYERLGLMDQPDRTESRYRLYSEEDVELLRFIQKAKLFGLSLDEIKELIAISAEGNTPCEHLKRLVQHHIDDLDRRIREMTAFSPKAAMPFALPLIAPWSTLAMKAFSRRLISRYQFSKRIQVPMSLCATASAGPTAALSTRSQLPARVPLSPR